MQRNSGTRNENGTNRERSAVLREFQILPIPMERNERKQSEQHVPKMTFKYCFYRSFLLSCI